MYEITENDIKFCDSYTAKLCRKCGRLPDDDAIQSGREGLCEAAHDYDPNRSPSFKGWAAWKIRHRVYRNYFGMNSGDALNQHEKKIDNFEDFCYSYNSHEASVVTKDLFYKALHRATPMQAEVIKEMVLEDKNAYQMAREHGKTHQSYSLLYKHGCERMKTHKMKEEFKND